ncbi:MAG TPA: hypothetical protein VEL05_07780, partial [Candidatus Acidoferrum sp.]|nr:hypothetical protein [Candidatus Acidoferrum sp.]
PLPFAAAAPAVQPAPSPLAVAGSAPVSLSPLTDAGPPPSSSSVLVAATATESSPSQVPERVFSIVRAADEHEDAASIPQNWPAASPTDAIPFAAAPASGQEPAPPAPNEWPQASVTDAPRQSAYGPPPPPWFDRELDRRLHEPFGGTVDEILGARAAEVQHEPFDQGAPEAQDASFNDGELYAPIEPFEPVEPPLHETHRVETARDSTFGDSTSADHSFEDQPFGFDGRRFDAESHGQSHADRSSGDEGDLHPPIDGDGFGDTAFSEHQHSETYGEPAAWEPVFGEQVFGEQNFGEQLFGDQSPAQQFRPQPLRPETFRSERFRSEHFPPEDLPPDRFALEHRSAEQFPAEPFPADPFRSERLPPEHLPPDDLRLEESVPPAQADEELRPAKAVWKQAHPSARRWVDSRQRVQGLHRAPSPPRIAAGLLLAGLGAWLLLSFLPDKKPLTEPERVRISRQAGVDEHAWRFPPPLYTAAQGGAALYVSLGFLIAVRGLFFRRRIEVACRRCQRTVIAERRALVLRCESGGHTVGTNWGAVWLQLAVLAVTLALIGLVVMAKLKIDIGFGVYPG